MVSQYEIMIGFSHPKEPKIISEAIRFIEKTDFSHVFIAVVDHTRSNGWIFQKDIVNKNPMMSISEFLKKNRIIENYFIAISPDQKAAVLRYFAINMHIKYGISKILGHLISKIMRKIGINFPNILWNLTKSMTCMDFVCNALKTAGIQVDTSKLSTGGLQNMRKIIKDLFKN